MHIATPEENSYIEAFHSIVQREVIERYEFTGFYDAKQTLLAHKIWYNSRRFHKAIKMRPNEKWDQDITNQNYQYLRQNLNPKTSN
jgi:transposase InsO family protein